MIRVSEAETAKYAEQDEATLRELISERELEVADDASQEDLVGALEFDDRVKSIEPLEGEDLDKALDACEAAVEEAGDDPTPEQILALAVEIGVADEDTDPQEAAVTLVAFAIVHQEAFTERFDEDEVNEGPLSDEQREAYNKLNAKDAEKFVRGLEDDDEVRAYIEYEKATEDRAFTKHFDVEPAGDGDGDGEQPPSDGPSDLDEGNQPTGEGDDGEAPTDIEGTHTDLDADPPEAKEYPDDCLQEDILHEGAIVEAGEEIPDDLTKAQLERFKRLGIVK